jgi:hypothetical protein
VHEGGQPEIPFVLASAPNHDKEDLEFVDGTPSMANASNHKFRDDERTEPAHAHQFVGTEKIGLDTAPCSNISNHVFRELEVDDGPGRFKHHSSDVLRNEKHLYAGSDPQAAPDHEPREVAENLFDNYSRGGTEKIDLDNTPSQDLTNFVHRSLDPDSGPTRFKHEIGITEIKGLAIEDSGPSDVFPHRDLEPGRMDYSNSGNSALPIDTNLTKNISEHRYRDAAHRGMSYGRESSSVNIKGDNSGVVVIDHRDIKPGNLCFQLDQNRPVVDPSPLCEVVQPAHIKKNGIWP